MEKLLLIVCLFFSISACSQVGVQFHMGMASAKNDNTTMTPDGTAHTGIFLCLTSKMTPKEKFSIFGSGKYVDLEFMAQERDEWFTRTETMNWLKFRLGGIYKVLEFSKVSYLRVSGALAANLLLTWPVDNPNAPFNRFNPPSSGVVIGIGGEYRGIILEFEYEIGILNQITDVGNSRFNYWDLGVGFHF